MSTAALVRGSEDLPDWHELMAAFSAWSAGEHPVTACACRLARLHRRRCPRRRKVVARRRAQLIEAIDAWAADHLCSPARVGSIGVYVDRMAAAVAEAHRALRNGEPMSGAVHTAFTDAAVLAAGWTEITSAAVPRVYLGVDQ
ncbi:hypothetical protein [Nocardia sp. NBC_01388]|uniref:hypothetical protein n=1 Tax=Nocardia sp. NBC_01388 TaxID=2903596 RepID=UPI003247AB1F